MKITLEILNELEHYHNLIITNRKSIIAFIDEFSGTNNDKIIETIKFVKKFYGNYPEYDRLKYIRNWKNKIINNEPVTEEWNLSKIDNGIKSIVQLIVSILLFVCSPSVHANIKTYKLSIPLIEKIENVINNLLYFYVASNKYNFFQNLKNFDESINVPNLEFSKFYIQNFFKEKNIDDIKYILFDFKEKIKFGENFNFNDLYEAISQELFPEKSNVIQFPKK